MKKIIFTLLIIGLLTSIIVNIYFNSKIVEMKKSNAEQNMKLTDKIEELRIEKEDHIKTKTICELQAKRLIKCQMQKK